MASGDTGKKGTPGGANAGSEKMGQLGARGAKSGTGNGRKGSKSTAKARTSAT